MQLRIFMKLSLKGIRSLCLGLGMGYIGWFGTYGATSITAQAADLGDPVVKEELIGRAASGKLTKPDGLTVLIEGDQVTVSWNEAEETIVGFNVYRSTLWADEYEHLLNEEGASYSTTEPKFVDFGLIPSEVYFYKVESVGEAGKSELSDAIEVIVSQQESGGLLENDSYLKPDQPYVSQEDAPSIQTRFLTAKRIWGAGLLLGSVGFVYQGFVFKDDADKIFERYKTADSGEADRLFQQTSNKDVKGQVSWAVGAAFAVAGLRLILSRDTPTSDISVASVTLPGALPLAVNARVLPRQIGLSLSKSF